MPGRPLDQGDIGRPPQAGDVFLMDHAVDGTSWMDWSRVQAKIDAAVSNAVSGGSIPSGNFTKVHVTPGAGITQVSTPGIIAASFHAVWRGNAPQIPYTGVLPVPAGHYHVDEAAGLVNVPALSGAEPVLVIYDASNQWRKEVFVAVGGETVIPIIGLGTAVFTQVWASMTPLQEQVAGGAVASGFYHTDLVNEEIELGDAALAGQIFLIIYKA